MKRNDLRNVAIIAHVDHGKTTLVDEMLRQSGQYRAGELEKLEGGQHGLIMDSNELERERGITILAKNCAIRWGDTKINIIDTPGHADFGGEVERVLRMADGAALLVDAAEGPLPQTRFVLRKAFECGLKPIVVINKIDRPDARVQEVLNAIFDLFVDLDADDATCDFPIVYASGRNGWAKLSMDDECKDLRPLVETIMKHVPPPDVDLDAPVQFQVNNLDHSDFVGRIAVGKVYAGRLKKNQRIVVLGRENHKIEYNIKQLLTFDRLGRNEVDEVTAGDICAIVGMNDIEIGDTIADIDHPVPLPELKVDEPTLTMLFRINDSPFAGREGDYVTSRQLRDRLFKELERNVALRVVPAAKTDEFMVSGRGLLHLGILLETMRREGFELSVGKPRVIMKEHDGMKLEPVEYLVVECPQSSVGSVMELVGNRRAECLKMDARGELTHLEFTIPARGLIGLKTRLLTATSGQAIMHHTFYDYQPSRGTIPSRINGVMVATETGPATFYSIEALQERGLMFVSPQDQCYEGQIVAEHCRDNDLPVNIAREKKLTNMRNANAEKNVVLKAPKTMTLEMALEYIEDDELVEITPNSIRLRKAQLKEMDRKRSERSNRD